MKTWKKFSVLMIMIFAASTFSGCGGEKVSDNNAENISETTSNDNDKNTPANNSENKIKTAPPPIHIEPVGEHWIQSQNGIYLWNPSPVEGESVEWSGNYIQDGNYKFAEGSGQVTWYRYGRNTQIDEGNFEHGRHHGQFKHNFIKSGRVEYSYWSHGEEVTGARLAEQIFRDYHAAITNKNYNQAFNLLSAEQRQKSGDFNSYINNFSNTVSSTVNNLQLIGQDGNRYTFKFDSTTRERQGDKFKVQNFNGQVTIIVTDGRGYIDFLKSKKTAEFIE